MQYFSALTDVVSKNVIIGTSAAGSLIVAAILLLLTIAGCVKVLKKKSTPNKHK